MGRPYRKREFIAVRFGRCKACLDDDLLDKSGRCSSCADVGATHRDEIDEDEDDPGSECVPSGR